MMKMSTIDNKGLLPILVGSMRVRIHRPYIILINYHNLIYLEYAFHCLAWNDHQASTVLLILKYCSFINSLYIYIYKNTVTDSLTDWKEERKGRKRRI